MKQMIQREIKVIYKSVAIAFADMDYTGKGRVKEEDFFWTLVIYKLPFSKEEIQEYFIWENVFWGSDSHSITIHEFRKHFFPDSEYRES